MVGDIKAIETRFDGILFRSRIEARWACFFRSLGIQYEYEKERFDLGSEGVYLPDFWLPEHEVWIEIKGKHPTLDEIVKAQRLSRLTGNTAHIFFGGIPYPRSWYDDSRLGLMVSRHDGTFGCGKSSLVIFPEPRQITTSTTFKQAMSMDYHYWWTECETCGKLGIEYEGRDWRLPCKCFGEGEGGNHGWNYDSARLLQAYEAARSERFSGKTQQGSAART
jgi:hypothetical protein